MGEALISRLLVKGIYQPAAVMVGEPSPQRRDYLQNTYGITVTADNRQLLDDPELVVLAVKPQIVGDLAADLQRVVGAPPPLLISILAGVPLARLESLVPGWPVIRAMPNTPATVGSGMTAICRGQHATLAHGEAATTIFAAVGEVVEVAESLMDAVTGLSGSGPGYVALVIEALTDGGVAAGLPRAIAAQLALQTVLGTAQLIQETGLHPAVLKDRVTSPGGTTIAGIAQLEQRGLRSALIEAVRAACQRSKDLGHPS